MDDLVEKLRAIISVAENVDIAAEKAAEFVRALYMYDADEFVMKVPEGPSVLYVSSSTENRFVQTLDREMPFGGYPRIDAREKAIMLALLRHCLEQWETAETTP